MVCDSTQRKNADVDLLCNVISKKIYFVETFLEFFFLLEKLTQKDFFFEKWINYSFHLVLNSPY